jgi:signal transduction histidine kinase
MAVSAEKSSLNETAVIAAGRPSEPGDSEPTRRFEARVLMAFAAAGLAVFLLAAMTWKLTQDAVDAASRVSHTHEVLLSLARARSDTIQIELSTQSYRISGDTARLAERDAAVAAREIALGRIRELTAGKPRQQERWRQLRETADERMAISRRVVEVRETRGPEEAAAFVATVPLRQTQERLFRLLDEMNDEERLLLNERNATHARSRAISLAASVVAALALAALLVATYALIRRQLRTNEAARRALAESEAVLSRLNESLDRANRIKSAFLATMSHELRTPLNAIIGFTGIVLQELPGPLNDEQKKQLGMVRDSARHLLALINDILDISKIEADELKVAHEPFDLGVSLEKVAGIVAPLADRKGLALRLEGFEHVGEMTGDARRVEQILMNLLSNAIKFTEAGTVTLSVERMVGYIETEGAAPRAAVRLVVSDTGMGIRPEDMVQLFQPFRQVDSALARRHEGTGLGLAICRQLAALMGGKIEAESRFGEGSAFSVTLPIDGPGEKP